MKNRGIREKFLFVFIVCVAITLTLATLVSYISMESVYTSMNERNINTEFSHISSEMNMLLSEADRMLLSNIIGLDVGDDLVRHDVLSVADMSYPIREIAAEVRDIIHNNENIASVFFYIEDEWLLAMSNNSVRQFHSSGNQWLSQKTEQLFSEADHTLSLVGDVTEEDFPLDAGEGSALILYRKVRQLGKDCVYCINIKESSLYEVYDSFLYDERDIRILDSEGMIVSSGEKSEIGTTFELLAGEDISIRGTKTVNGLMIDYQPLEDYGLVIVNTIPISVYTGELTQMRNNLLYIFGFGMVITSCFFSYWIKRKLKPVEELQQGMRAAGLGDYTNYLPTEGTDELAELARDYNAMLTDLQNLTESRKQAEIELRERELATLRNEINPHFLYNTLNTVKCMADLAGNREISRCMIALGGIVSPLYKVTDPIWTLREEIQVVEKYMEIMNIRYGNRIVCTMNIPEELMDRQVMKFILQPVVENSILHGFADRAYVGQIVITVKEGDNNLQIILEDDGKGMTDRELEVYFTLLQQGSETGSVGMRNVNRRIALRYGAEYGMWLKHSELGGLCTLIRLPLV